jgi:rhamnosyltransferase
MLSSTPAAALETRCVDTVAELDAAVRISMEDDVEIHLVRGTYDIAGTILNWFAFEEPEPDDNLAIIGGYAPGCGSRFLDPYTGLQSSFTRLARLGVRRVACHPAAHEVQTDFLISSGSLIPLVAFDEIGPMEESLFIDQVDAEWCLRARSKDYRLFGACRAVLRHSLGEGATRVWFGRWRHVHPHKAFRYYYIFRNTVLLTRRPYVPVAWTLHGLWYLAGLLVVAGIMAKERSSVLPRMLKGVLDGVRGVTGRIVES